MNEITWLSHGGPGSGRYPKGSGKKYTKRKKKELKQKVKELNQIAKKRARVYTDLKFAKDKNEYTKLDKMDRDLIKRGNDIRKEILSKNKNVKLKDAFKIDRKYMLKYYGREPYAGAYSGYKIEYT